MRTLFGFVFSLLVWSVSAQGAESPVKTPGVGVLKLNTRFSGSVYREDGRTSVGGAEIKLVSLDGRIAARTSTGSSGRFGAVDLQL